MLEFMNGLLFKEISGINDIDILGPGGNLRLEDLVITFNEIPNKEERTGKILPKLPSTLPWTPMPLDYIIEPYIRVVPPKRQQPYIPVFPWSQPIVPGVIPWNPVIPWTPTVLKPIYIMPTDVIRSINPIINFSTTTQSATPFVASLSDVIERANFMHQVSYVRPQVPISVAQNGNISSGGITSTIPHIGGFVGETIKIDTSSVDATATELQRLGNEIENKLENIFTEVSRLDSSWNGSASNNAFSKFNTFKSKYKNSETIKDIFNQYVNMLNVNVKTDYETTESTNQNLSSLFK